MATLNITHSTADAQLNFFRLKISVNKIRASLFHKFCSCTFAWLHFILFQVHWHTLITCTAVVEERRGEVDFPAIFRKKKKRMCLSTQWLDALPMEHFKSSNNLLNIFLFFIHPSIIFCQHFSSRFLEPSGPGMQMGYTLQKLPVYYYLLFFSFLRKNK